MKRFLVYIFCFPSLVFCQLQNQVYNLDTIRVVKNKFNINDDFHAESLHYLRNTEYLNLLHPSQTFFGNMVSSTYTIFKNPNNLFSLKVGALLKADFGDPDFLSAFKPLLNLKIDEKHVQVNFGSIPSNTKHLMHDVLYNYENVFTNPVEYGLSFSLKNTKIKHHNWLEWRSLLNLKNQTPEQIIFGTNTTFPIFNSPKFKLLIPAQTIVYHSGGEGLNKPNITRINGLIGAEVVLHNFVKLGYLYFTHLDNSPKLIQAFSKGFSTYPYITIELKNHTIHAAYWYGLQFANTLGNSLYSNVNVFYPYANTQARQLIALRYNFSKVIYNKAIVDFRFEPLWDVNLQKFMHGAAISLRCLWD